MGMYASGPYVEDMKMTGLLATCVIEAAQKKYMGSKYDGAYLCEMDGHTLLEGGFVKLQRDEVEAVIFLMHG